MKTTTTAQYLHGTHEEEQRRLSALNTIVNDASLSEIRLRGDERVLDIGSGLGQLARAMARRVYPHGSVVAVEGNAEQIMSARRFAAHDREANLVDFRHGDAHSLPLSGAEWNSFDVVHTRFVLEHVANPATVVQQMVNAARPGGRVIIQDCDHGMAWFAHAPASFTRLWAAYLEVYRFNDGNPYVARDVPQLLLNAGASPRRSRIIDHGGCAGTPGFRDVADHLVNMVAGATPRIVACGLMDEAAAAAGVHEVRAWSYRADAAFWFPFYWAEAIRPGTIQ